jgi:hypothetical protein
MLKVCKEHILFNCFKTSVLNGFMCKIRIIPLIDFSCNTYRIVVTNRKDWYIIKEDMFLADLQHINISQINLINDIQAATYMWYTLFMRIINKHAPDWYICFNNMFWVTYINMINNRACSRCNSCRFID